MNKNTATRHRQALKNFSKGQNSTTFEILQTLPGSKALGVRKYTIVIGNAPRKSKHPKVANKSINTVSTQESTN